MWVIPITYKIEFDKHKLNKVEIFNLIEECLNELDFKYINRNANRIFFYDGSFIQLQKKREYIGSGTVKIKETGEKFIIKLTHSGVFLILIIFAILYLLFFSRYSTFDTEDKEIFFTIFYFLFGISYITKLYWHNKLIQIFKKKIEGTKTQKENKIH